MKKIIISLLCLIQTCIFANQDIVGYWTTMDGDTPQSIIGIYEHGNKYFGRIIGTFTDGILVETLDNPTKKAEGVVGNPYYVGLDIIWDLHKGEDIKFVEGKILDPQKGRVYDSAMWREGDNLVVRGELKIFGRPIGRNQTWLPVKDSDLPKEFKKPDLKELVPKIPEVIKK